MDIESYVQIAGEFVTFVVINLVYFKFEFKIFKINVKNVIS